MKRTNCWQLSLITTEQGYMYLHVPLLLHTEQLTTTVSLCTKKKSAHNSSRSNVKINCPLLYFPGSKFKWKPPPANTKPLREIKEGKGSKKKKKRRERSSSAVLIMLYLVWLLFLLFSISTFSFDIAGDDGFDWEVANITVALSALAYCDKQSYLNREYTQTQLLKFIPTSSIRSEEHDVNGFIGIQDKSIYVVFRGSQSFSNFLDGNSAYIHHLTLCQHMRTAHQHVVYIQNRSFIR